MAKHKKDERDWVVTPEGSIHIWKRGDVWHHYINRKGHPIQRRTAEASSYTEAREKAEKLAASWNPLAQENARLKEQKEHEQTKIEDAVNGFLADRTDRLGDDGAGTVETYRVVVGYSKRCPFALLNWIETYNQTHAEKLVNVSQLTPQILGAWRQAWVLKTSTKKIRWTIVGMFVLYCIKRGLLTGLNPHTVIGAVAGSTSGGTGTMSEQQWLSFEACCDPLERVFFSTMRWGGCALVDATMFSKGNVTKEGVLVYQRFKLRRHSDQGWAQVKLPSHVVRLLAATDGDMPFRYPQPGMTLIEAKVWWSARFNAICEKAGITEIETRRGSVRGTERPHTHCLRDTFAVWLYSVTRDLKLVSKALGHSTTIMTERRYLPWVKELEAAHNAAFDRALETVHTIEAVETRVQ